MKKQIITLLIVIILSSVTVIGEEIITYKHINKFYSGGNYIHSGNEECANIGVNSCVRVEFLNKNTKQWETFPNDPPTVTKNGCVGDPSFSSYVPVYISYMSGFRAVCNILTYSTQRITQSAVHDGDATLQYEINDVGGVMPTKITDGTATLQVYNTEAQPFLEKTNIPDNSVLNFKGQFYSCNLENYITPNGINLFDRFNRMFSGTGIIDQDFCTVPSTTSLPATPIAADYSSKFCDIDNGWKSISSWKDNSNIPLALTLKSEPVNLILNGEFSTAVDKWSIPITSSILDSAGGIKLNKDKPLSQTVTIKTDTAYFITFDHKNSAGKLTINSTTNSLKKDDAPATDTYFWSKGQPNAEIIIKPHFKSSPIAMVF